jgi:hypothetical protein
VVVRRSVPLVLTALALASSASAYAGLVTPILTAGQTQTFQLGQFTSQETLSCIGAGSHVTARVPTVTKADALAAARQGYHWGNLRVNDGLALSIVVNRDRSIIVKCYSTAFPIPRPSDGWGKAVPDPDRTIPLCKAGQHSTVNNPCAKAPA